MGYYSDVALTLKKADAIELVRQAQENTYAKELFNCVTSIHEDSDYVTFVWNCVKWYSQFDDVQFVTNFYQALGTYHFQRIGEDLRDIEEEWNDEDDEDYRVVEACEISRDFYFPSGQELTLSSFKEAVSSTAKSMEAN